MVTKCLHLRTATCTRCLLVRECLDCGLHGSYESEVIGEIGAANLPLLSEAELHHARRVLAEAGTGGFYLTPGDIGRVPRSRAFVEELLEEQKSRLCKINIARCVRGQQEDLDLYDKLLADGRVGPLKPGGPVCMHRRTVLCSACLEVPVCLDCGLHGANQVCHPPTPDRGVPTYGLSDSERTFRRTASGIALMIHEDVERVTYGRPGRPNFTSLLTFLTLEGEEMLRTCQDFRRLVLELPAGNERDHLVEVLTGERE